MSWLARIDFQDGSGWRDITNIVDLSSLRRSQRRWRELNPTIDTCDFSLLYDSTILNKLLTTTKSIKVNIQKDASDYFTGYVRTDFDAQMRTRFQRVSIKCVDPGVLLQQQKIRPSVAALWEGYKVSDPSNKSSSILHRLLYSAGVADADINLPLIDRTIDYYRHVTEDVTYFERIGKILFQFGYVFYHDVSGVLQAFSFCPATVTTTNQFDNSNMYGALSMQKTEEKYEGVEVDWKSHKTISGVVVFSDTTGGDETYKCNITLGADEYYPLGSDLKTVYADYQLNGEKIVAVLTPALDDSLGGGIVNELFTNFFTKAGVRFHNAGGSAAGIHKFDIVGDAVVESGVNVNKYLHVSGTEKVLKIEADYVRTSADADKLAIGVDRYYHYNDFVYTLLCRTDYEVGDFVHIVDTTDLGIDNICVIVEKVTNERTGYIQYVCEGIAEYTADSTETEGSVSSPAPSTQEQNNQTAIEQKASYADIVSGFDHGGGTTVPTVPTVTAQGIKNSIVLRCDMQINLTNFDHFEIQVSADETNWYSLRFDGTDWKDTLDNWTDGAGPILVHTNIPYGGTVDDPTGVALYYRVRRVTKEPSSSAWSSAISGSTTTIDTGDIGYRAITVEKIDTTVLNTLIANVNDRLVVSDLTGYTAYNLAGAAPAIDDTRVYIDTDEVNIGKITVLGSPNTVDNATWGTIARLYANSGNGVLEIGGGVIKLGSIETAGDNRVYFGDVVYLSQKDPALAFIGANTSNSTGVLGAYYAAFFNNPVTYLGNNIYYSGGGWSNPDSSKGSTGLLLGTAGISVYIASAGGSLGALHTSIDADGIWVRTPTNMGSYLAMLKSTSALPGYPDKPYPTIKTDHQYLYLSMGGAYSAYIGGDGSYHVMAGGVVWRACFN